MTQPSRLVASPNPPAAHCEGKHPFPTPQIARKSISRHPRGKITRQAYRCQYCGLWHIGGIRK